MKIKNYVLFTLLSFLFMSCTFIDGKSIRPSNNYVTKSVTVDNFNGISTSSGIDVKYFQSNDASKVEIYASDNVIEYIEVKVKDGILNVRMKDKINIINFIKTGKMEVRISAPEVSILKSSSGGNIYLTSALKCNSDMLVSTSSGGGIKGSSISCNNLKMTASSAGKINIDNLKCSDVLAEASSSGDINIVNLLCGEIDANISSSGSINMQKGSSEKARYNCSSAGDIKAKGFITQYVEAHVSSAGNVICNVSKDLKVETSSAGKLDYVGNPNVINLSNSGIHKIN